LTFAAKFGKPLSLSVILWLACSRCVTLAQQSPADSDSADAMRAYYDAAERLLSTQDKEQAAFQFRLFLREALRRIAEDRSRIGEYAAAVPLFQRALELGPTDVAVRWGYADAALAARDYSEAKELLNAPSAACAKVPAQSSCARVHLMLGRALFGMADYQPAKDQFEAAVAIDPTFETGYALGKAYLALSDRGQTARIFAEMVASFGDSAAIHLDFGRAYGEADFPEEAIQEFKAAMAEDDARPGVHYGLGAAYLMRSGDTGFVEAEAQFRKELTLHPDDPYSYSQLGYIAMSRHDLAEAERNLSRASKLDPRNPDNFLLLGEIYTHLDRLADAEAALRNAIVTTTDPSRNHYQVRGAHYQLGRLLIRRGEVDEGKKQLRIAEDLLIQNSLLDRVNLAGKPIACYQFPQAIASLPADPQAQAAVRDFERRVAPAIADSYNNLGAVAAGDHNYAEAVDDFAQAATWNPTLEGLDLNWGKAAFAMKQYRQATVCLGRYLESHPHAANVREPLGFSRFMLQDYAGAIAAMAPIAAELDATPLLDYAYAESLVMTGEYDDGVTRLQQLERPNPGLAMVHVALGKALLNHSAYTGAETELRTALALKPEDAEVSFLLAQDLIAQKRERDAEQILAGLIGHGSKDPGVYRQIGRLQLKNGDLVAAIRNLETAEGLDPRSVSTHQELAEAYLRAARAEEAMREKKLIETLQAQAPSKENKTDQK